MVSGRIFLARTWSSLSRSNSSRCCIRSIQCLQYRLFSQIKARGDVSNPKERAMDHERDSSSAPQMELEYTSELYNYVFLGKASTMVFGGICMSISPFLLLYPFETEFVEFFEYLPVRCALSLTVFGIGFLLPRSFALITNDHVLRMFYCRKTRKMRLETVSTFMRTQVFEMKMSDLRLVEQSERFGANNIICKST